MDRNEALRKSQEKYSIEDPEIINLCIKRLGLTNEEFNSYIAQAPRLFKEFPNNYSLIRFLKPAIWVSSKLNLIPSSTYDKYFNCGK